MHVSRRSNSLLLTNIRSSWSITVINTYGGSYIDIGYKFAIVRAPKSAMSPMELDSETSRIKSYNSTKWANKTVYIKFNSVPITLDRVLSVPVIVSHLKSNHTLMTISQLPSSKISNSGHHRLFSWVQM